MECTEVQKRLSAYIEEVVSPKQRALIDAHLKGCKQCKRALADLKKTIEYVQGLEEVESPAWLTQKVMAGVRSEAEAKGGIFKKIFYPFHIKLPLEALALVLVAVGAIYIFKAMQPEMKLARAPMEHEESAPPPRAPGIGEVHDVAEDTRHPAEPAVQFRDTDKEKTRARKPVGVVKAPADAAKREEAAPSAGIASTDQLERRALSSLEESKKTVIEPEAQAVRFVVNVKTIEPATQDTEETLRKLGGRKIKTESLRDKTIINAEIDSKQMKELFDQLNLIGEVQEERAASEAWKGDEVQEEGVALEEWKGDVGIQIELEKHAQ
jgi:anti-sigma factor RsiW